MIQAQNKILVIGDAHVEVGTNLERFKALGNYIVAEQPDIVVSIGDFLSLDVLSDWDKDKRKVMEGQRYAEEINTGNDALDLWLKPLSEYNTKAKKSKKRGYNPRLIYIMGNHEDRLDRYLLNDPKFHGFVDLSKDLKLKSRGFEIVPYRSHIDINGIAFTHIPIGYNGRPVGGKYSVFKSLELYSTSIVYGHTHSLAVANKYRHGQKHLQQGLNCGCFFEDEPEWIKGAGPEWWKGIILLDNYDYMRFDFQTISMSQLKNEYLST